jgi:glutamine amidotransferase
VIALVDYRAGNLTSVKKGLRAAGADVFVPERPADLASASGIVVPGVGHFSATRALDDEWREAILEHISIGRPLLGICLGMQWLFEGSEEAPELTGLGLLPGQCVRLDPNAGTVRLKADTTYGGDLKVPHVGWNSVALLRESWLTAEVPACAQVYFTHSYIAPLTADTVATVEHGIAFAAMVQRGAVAGVQFHPEKSGDVGLRILRNFVAHAC